MEVLDLITHAPFPVSKASRSPFFPIINPPVGKSGPKINFPKSSRLALGLSIINKVASITSPKLWGGMLVAIPTAIPEAPLTKRLGYCAGKTVGSFVLSS